MKKRGGWKRPDVAKSNRERIGPLHPCFGKKNPDVAERNKKRSGSLHPMFGRTGSRSPIFGKKRPDVSERMKGPSNPMRGKGSIGSSNPNWKGGKYITGDGYVSILCPDHSRANKHGYIFEHILIVEKKLKRSLSKKEVVHHIDMDRQNNDPENLRVFSTNGDHFSYHRRLKQYFD